MSALARLCCSAFVAALLVLPATALAEGGCPRPDGKPNIALGASVSGLLFLESPRRQLGLELSISSSFLWIASGARLGPATSELARTGYVEAGAYLFPVFLNLGIGASVSGGGDLPRAAAHAFIGFPIVIEDFFGMRPGTFYIEPYYRPNIGLTRVRAFHELGVLIKVMTVNVQ